MAPDKDTLKKERKQDRKIRHPTATEFLELDDDERLIIRSISLFCASQLLSRDSIATARGTIAMATKFEHYLLLGIHPDDEERDD